MRNFALYILLFLLLKLSSFSQQYNFHNYSVKEGVAQSQVFSLLQDNRGYLWMGTRGGGVTQFDGTTFKTFTIKDGLPNNYISCINCFLTMLTSVSTSTIDFSSFNRAIVS